MIDKKRVLHRAYKRLTSYAQDPVKMNMYDLLDHEELPSCKPSLQYPDWTEEGTFTVSGPLGPHSLRRGRRFTSIKEALLFYIGLQGGEPVEMHSEKPTKGHETEDRKGQGGSGYFFRFRGPRSAALIEAGQARQLEQEVQNEQAS